MRNKTVYHATSLGNGKAIKKTGWEVSINGRNIFGRGIYFWELKDDAHTYGQQIFGSNTYEIVSEDLPIKPTNSILYDQNKVRTEDWDEIARSFMSKGIEVIIIPNPIMESFTCSRAKGRAFVWLVDIRQPNRIVVLP